MIAPVQRLANGKARAHQTLHQAALRIVAMRQSGMEDPDIARVLGISVKCIAPYLYKAGKRGYLSFDDPKDTVEYRMMHKVVRNLDAMLDSPEILSKGERSVKQEVTLEVAKGTLFKRFEAAPAVSAPQTIVAIRIETPPGPAQAMREDAAGGVPAYVDAETVSRAQAPS